MGEVRIAKVTWIDSSIQNGQVDKYGFPTPERLVTVGYVVADTPEHITLARDDSGEGEYRGLCSIPKVCVREVCELVTGGTTPSKKKI